MHCKLRGDSLAGSHLSYPACFHLQPADPISRTRLWCARGEPAWLEHPQALVFMQAEAKQRGQGGQGSQADLAAISGNVLSLEDVTAGGTAGLLTKIAGNALVGPANDSRKQPSVAHLLERFER